MPIESGLVVRDICFLSNEENFEIDLPNKNYDDLQTLSEDINQSLVRNEPTLVLDRLHTFAVKYIRGLCEKKGIVIINYKAESYPLHSLVGMLTKHYKQVNAFQSEFSEQALKVSISLYDKYNAVRNDRSYAHDNTVLNNAEATLSVKIMAATLMF